ncbi:hypothetical protein K144313037_24340 [Clostridium tetani]|uniref:RQC P-site tRNA stabilizing factor n=1 Tax=Clostridium tetani TaxID=1513 RepID=A0A4Q0VBK2_CLOTA|nr:RNA-binding S4 domain-containing protein [Clostridium tetani]AVP55949.1 RNA-binding S4 domain-containing protein [Clostridium tetani]KGI38775.1 RNA-binding protein S4 [Clostridium tetani ATCC 9441]KGI40694.1 RNA-binding protein S4 [Clostridium tetani]KGI43531.1 RNA-binding protein S4 [Clostridium tetani]KGI46403.1 RNA-binding protein S4 [Clostridium tetani]
MRLDKYLKVSRIIKRRTVAKEVCESGRVFINGRAAKAGSEVKEGDLIEINYAEGTMKAKVLDISSHALKNEAKYMYEIISE